MAIQKGPVFFTGTIDGICFYKRGNKYHLRPARPVSAETVRTSDKFRNSRRSAGELAAASRIASEIYRCLPKEKKDVSLYRKMTGVAKLMLKEGDTNEAIRTALEECIAVFWGMRPVGKILNKPKRKFWQGKATRIGPAGEWIRKQNKALAEGLSLRSGTKRYFKFSKGFVFELNIESPYTRKLSTKFSRLNLPLTKTG